MNFAKVLNICSKCAYIRNIGYPAVRSDNEDVVSGQPFSYQIVASPYITGYSATNLPAGLSVNTSTGLITGTVTNPSVATYTIGLGAVNLKGNGSGTLTLNVIGYVPVVSNATVNVGTGRPFSYTISATGVPAITSYGATSLPTGLSINTSTGAITGTITSPTITSYTVGISATNSVGTGTGTLTIDVKNVMAIVFGQATVQGGVGSITNFLTVKLDGGSAIPTVTGTTYYALSSFEVSGTQGFSVAVPGGANTLVYQDFTWAASNAITVKGTSTSSASTTAVTGSSQLFVYPENDNTLSRELTIISGASDPQSVSDTMSGDIAGVSGASGQVGAYSSSNTGSFTGDIKINFQ